MDKSVELKLESIYEGHAMASYRGIKCFSCPFDYLMYQMLLHSVQPDLIIEIGTAYGGQALYLSDLQKTLYGGGTVHTIDVREPIPHADGFEMSPLVRDNPNIVLFNDGWEGYDIIQAKQFKKVLVIDDGCHTYEGVSGALDKFAPIVTNDSYYIVEDGIIDELHPAKADIPKNTPCHAIEDFLFSLERGGGKFKIDEKYCDMFGKNATFNTIGYLRRVAK